jgi:patatin-like phospholipase/acyl hydrolase
MYAFDSGGIRGVVELCVMQALEEQLKISLHHFFDLVVGTR